MSADRETASAIVKELENAWNAADGVRFGKPFTEDADFVTIRAEHLRTREAIAKGHQGIFDTIYKGSTVRYELVSARPVAPGVALAYESRAECSDRASGRQAQLALHDRAGAATDRLAHCGVSQHADQITTRAHALFVCSVAQGRQRGDRGDDADAGEEGEPGLGGHCRLRLIQHAAPTGRRRLHPDTEEAERRLHQNGAPHGEHRRDANGARRIHQQMPAP